MHRNWKSSIFGWGWIELSLDPVNISIGGSHTHLTYCQIRDSKQWFCDPNKLKVF